MNNNRSIKALVCALGIFAVSAGAISLFSSSSNGRGAFFGLTRKDKTAAEVGINPAEYDEVSSASLTPKIVSYTGTSLSRHLNVQFESQVITAFSGRRKDVYFVIDDENYTGDRSNPFVVDDGDRNLNGFIYRAAAASTTGSTLYLSNTIKYGSRFTIVNTKVAANCMSVTETENSYVYSDTPLEAVYICNGIETIEAGALVNVPNTVTIKCEVASKPTGWEDGWTDAANIEWGVAIPDSSQKDISVSGGTTSFGDAEDFILGFKGNESEHIDPYLLTLGYQKTTKNGLLVTEYQQLPVKHLTNDYDAVGSEIYGTTNNFDITIDLDEGDVIDEHSFEFYNIFKAKKVYSDKKVAWPSDIIDEIETKYTLPVDEHLVPILDGNIFSYQLFEATSDSYIYVTAGFDQESSADALVNTFKGKLETLGYTLDESKAEATYGYVYSLSPSEDSNITIQFYRFEDHFISYVFFDTLVINDEGKYVPSHAYPIEAKKAAVRPFYFTIDLEQGKLKSHATARYGKMTDFNDIFKTTYRSSSSFMGYTSVSMTLDKVLTTAYKGVVFAEDPEKSVVLMKNEEGKYYRGDKVYEDEEVEISQAFSAPSLYLNDSSCRTKVENNIDTIANGGIIFRYTLTNLNTASIIAVYKEGNEVKKAILPINSPSPVIEVDSDSGNVLSFLLEGSKIEAFSSDNLLSLGVSGMTVSIHLYNVSSHSVVQNTALLNVFGNVEVLPYNNNGLSYFNINLYLILFFVGLTVVYAAASCGLFFYKKNKYKNDEFRRIKPKQYIKSAVIGLIGLLLIAAGLNFIILRFAVFMSAVPVFNPIDAFVIAFALAGAIALGFFIKSFANALKTAKKLREIKRLHLDKDVVDDGTH